VYKKLPNYTCLQGLDHMFVSHFGLKKDQPGITLKILCSQFKSLLSPHFMIFECFANVKVISNRLPLLFLISTYTNKLPLWFFIPISCRSWHQHIYPPHFALYFFLFFTSTIIIINNLSIKSLHYLSIHLIFPSTSNLYYQPCACNLKLKYLSSKAKFQKYLSHQNSGRRCKSHGQTDIHIGDPMLYKKLDSTSFACENKSMKRGR